MVAVGKVGFGGEGCIIIGSRDGVCVWGGVGVGGWYYYYYYYY